MKIIDKLFNTYSIPNVKSYYILGFLKMGAFPIPNWVFYFAQYMTFKEIGIIDGISILIGIIAEIPTGAFGDLIGKKKTLIIGYAVMFMGCIILAVSFQKYQFFLGNTTLFIGMAFVSGAQEAFGYDSLLEKGKESFYSKVSSNYNIIGIISLLTSLFMGGMLYSISPRLPWLAVGIYFLIAVYIVIKSQEPSVDSYKFSLGNYFGQFNKGFHNLFSSKLLKYSLFIILLSGIIELGQGFVRQSTAFYFGFNGTNFAFVMASTVIIAALILLKLDKIISFFGNIRLFILLSFGLASAYSLAIFSDNWMIGIFVFLLITISAKLSLPFISMVVNQNIDSKDRATTISTVSLFSQIPYIFTVVFFGSVGEKENIQMLYFIIILVLTLMIFCGTSIYIYLREDK